MRTHWRMLQKNERGATAVYAAVVLAVLLMFAGLAVDVNYLYGVRNELHNAADAGALAGASVLFSDHDGSLERQAAIDEATRIATANKTGTENVSEIIAETGHWSFKDKKFTANENTTQVEWQERSFDELDADTDFINAVRVYTARSDTPSFFANILGYDKFFVSTDAVAYIGFAGTLHPNELDMPIAICEEAILVEGKYSCTVGRMLNDGNKLDTSESAMWTNFTQNNPADPSQNSCETANLPTVSPMTSECTGNPNTVTFGLGIGSTNGTDTPILMDVIDCWMAYADSDTDGTPDRYWPLMLPVVDCKSDNTCAPLVGAVQVNVVWVHIDPGSWDNIKSDDKVPTVMEDWSCETGGTPEGRKICWRSFVDYFNLRNVNSPPPLPDLTEDDYETMYELLKNVYFVPDCGDHTPTGLTGGQNFGVLAKIPKLVK